MINAAPQPRLFLARVRAAFLADAERFRLPLVFAAFLADAERSAAVRRAALDVVWRESASCDTDLLPSRFSAFVAAADRLRETGSCR